MWANDIGRFQAANMGLLKAIFEMNLQLFKENQDSHKKTLLLFVIRDYSAQTPKERLKQMLMADMERIWNGISKPSQYTEAKVRLWIYLDRYLFNNLN